MQLGFRIILSKMLIFASLLMAPLVVQAQVEWNEPEVVPESLYRANRRVLRFSGSTEPGAQIRIRGGKIKMFLPNGKAKTARIPQKNRVQFPVSAEDNGEFSFDLYLPTMAVEIPVEIYIGSRWVPYTLNFRVPEEGEANDFEAVVDSFQPKGGGPTAPTDYGGYSSEEDLGQRIRSRDEDEDEERGPEKYAIWGSLSLAYTSIGMENNFVTPVKVDESTVTFPGIRLGFDYRHSKKWKGQFALRSISGQIDQPASLTPSVLGDPVLDGKDFNWLETQFSAVYFFDGWTTKWGPYGLDFGLQTQDFPYLRNRPALSNFAFFDSMNFFLHAGLHLESKGEQEYPWELYARLLYAVMSGSNYDIDMGFGFEAGGGLTRHIFPGFKIGLFSQLEYFMMDTSFPDNGTTREQDYNLLFFSAEIRAILTF